MIKKIVLPLMIGSLLSASSLIQEQEKDLIQTILPNTKIGKVEHSQIDGLYKVYLNNGNLIYVYPYKRLVFFGEIYTNTGLNLTAQDRQSWKDKVVKENLSKISSEELIKNAFKLDFGKGANRYAFVLFTDPECPFCRKVDKFVKNTKPNLSVYVNYMPLYFHKNAKKWALQILSSKNKKEAIDKIETTNKDLNVKITQQAKDTLKKTTELAKKLNIRGTPTIFVIDTKTHKVVDLIKGANIPKIQEWIKKDENAK